eukprot:TRINITY_DN4026_c0_g1_i1.p1 TRINITY_DN4026_c0_g1~~TRINITY_DN4026_c0_g1_i1.p1  ORF type:complete len:217 (-),score=42.86 TRINITY_DN4026_c0_g1_i1:22-672(-)
MSVQKTSLNDTISIGVDPKALTFDKFVSAYNKISIVGVQSKIETRNIPRATLLQLQLIGRNIAADGFPLAAKHLEEGYSEEGPYLSIVEEKTQDRVYRHTIVLSRRVGNHRHVIISTGRRKLGVGWIGGAFTVFAAGIIFLSGGWIPASIVVGTKLALDVAASQRDILQTEMLKDIGKYINIDWRKAEVLINGPASEEEEEEEEDQDENSILMMDL